MSATQIFELFCQASPLPVTARAALEHAVRDEILDTHFAELAKCQDTGELVSSAVVDASAHQPMFSCRRSLNPGWTFRSDAG
jgi:hypothetical protein